ncbi:MAG: transporter substrate-binding domain-containing protein [Alphaproteobacteria bacterium]|nr:transporter substrate-binding domain-containing protein [Alphaproteobacteria bacterium]
MVHFKQTISIIVIAAATTLAVQHFAPQTSAAPKQETTFERVMRTRVLRCAYLPYPPEIIKDPNTGKLSGYIVDITEEIGHQLNLKIEWTTELGFGFQNVPADFKTGRYDAVCSGFVETAAHASAALFSTPIDYAPVYAYVRADDTRFDQSLDLINDPAIKIAVIDGESGQSIAREVFPRSSSHSLPEMSDVSLSLESVATRKADMAISTIATAKGYMEHNPGKLKVIRNHPIKSWIQPSMAFPHGEHDFKYVVDATIRALHENGFIEHTFKKYDPKLESYLMVAKPYQLRK